MDFSLGLFVALVCEIATLSRVDPQEQRTASSPLPKPGETHQNRRLCPNV